MFNLLNLIIDFTSRISGTTDINVGENPGQNTPAETSRAMVEQGQKIYSAIFKRIWRSLKREFQKLYKLNAVHLRQRKLNPHQHSCSQDARAVLAEPGRRTNREALAGS